MKLNIKKDVLNEKLNIVSKAISSKNIIPVLSGIKMDLKNEGLFLTASNDEIAIETFIDCNNIVSIDEIGSIVVPGKYFLEIIRKIEDETVYIETDGLNTLITTKRGEYSLNGMSATEFPNIKLELVKNPIIINEKIIKNIVSQTSFAVSTQESRPVLTGINFKIENSTMECVATDSYRLAKKIITLDKDVENKINIVIPGRNLVELTKLLTDDEKFVEMHVFSNNVLFKSKDMLFQSRLLNNSYPDLSKLIPDEYELVLKLNLVEFYNTIDRVSLLTSEKDKNQVKMEINSDDIIESDSELCYIKLKSWDKIYQNYMDVFRGWIADNKEQILEDLNNAIFLEDWNKYAKGTISAWEMEVLCFYYHPHELINVNHIKYGFSDFFKLPEEPIIDKEKTFVKNGKEIKIFKLQKICGTCIAKNKTKSTVTLLTTTGVVEVKFRKEYFTLFDKQISARDANGDKHIIEKSWFNRGNMIVVMGIRSGDNFIAKKYASTGGHQLYKIREIIDDTDLILTSERYQGEYEEEV